MDWEADADESSRPDSPRFYASLAAAEGFGGAGGREVDRPLAGTADDVIDGAELIKIARAAERPVIHPGDEDILDVELPW